MIYLISFRGLVQRLTPRYNTPLLCEVPTKIVEKNSMALSRATKAQIVKTYRTSKNDTGSSEVQIALLTTRINALTEHLKIHKHDVHSRYGLTKMVSKRRRLMRYLKNYDLESYKNLIKALEVRG